MSLNQNIKQGILSLTLDGNTIKFASTTNIAQDEPREFAMLKDMQGTGFIEYSQNNQAASTADFTLQNLDKSQLGAIVGLFNSRKAFDLSFIFEEGSRIDYKNPKIKKKPMRASISEGEDSFNVTLGINCTSIDEKIK
jgi:hypothetical protein